MSKLNTLLFMVDQLTSFLLKSYGGQYAKHSTLMHWHHVVPSVKMPIAYPLCTPSRLGMMAGRLPSRIVAYNNVAEFPAASPVARSMQINY